jgi:putative flippase GtrA
MSLPGPANPGSGGRYFWIVCVGYGVDLAVYVGLVQWGVHLYAAFFASFLAGGTFNVLLLRRYFAAGRHPLAKDLLLTYAGTGIVIALAFGLYVALMNLLGMPHLLAKILSNGASFVVNYALRRKFF